jgi:multiple sugar transport system substrate-binding protein
VLTLCASLGAAAGHGERCFPDEVAAERALALLARLAPILHPESATFNPPRAFDRMTTTDEIAYVPLAFGYTNYWLRRRFPARRCVGCSAGRASRFRPPLGTRRRQPRSPSGSAAATRRRASCSPPAASPRAALHGSIRHSTPPQADSSRGTLATIDAAHVRPREAWWPAFQEEAGRIVAAFLTGGDRASAAVIELEHAFARARAHAERRAA